MTNASGPSRDSTSGHGEEETLPAVAITFDGVFVTPPWLSPARPRFRDRDRSESRLDDPDDDRQRKRSSARNSAMASHSRAANRAQKRSPTRLAVFSSRGAGRLSFLEPRERCVEVCLVEKLAAVDQVPVDREQTDQSPLGLESLWRGPIRRWVTTAPRSLSRCTASM